MSHIKIFKIIINSIIFFGWVKKHTMKNVLIIHKEDSTAWESEVFMDIGSVLRDVSFSVIPFSAHSDVKAVQSFHVIYWKKTQRLAESSRPPAAVVFNYFLFVCVVCCVVCVVLCCSFVLFVLCCVVCVVLCCLFVLCCLCCLCCVVWVVCVVCVVLFVLFVLCCVVCLCCLCCVVCVVLKQIKQYKNKIYYYSWWD